MTKQILGRYRALATRRLASFVLAHKAFDSQTERPVAILAIDKGKLAATRAKLAYGMAQMRREAAAAAMLTHPHVLDVYEQFDDDNQFYVVSALAEYPSVADTLSIAGGNDLILAIDLYEKVINTIQYFNQNNIFGCCFREGNIYFGQNGDVKIENVFISRIRFIAEYPMLGRDLAKMALSTTGIFLDRERCARLDLLLAGELLESLVLSAKVAGKPQDAPDRGRQRLSEEISLVINKILQKLRGDGVRYPDVAALAEDVRAITRQTEGFLRRQEKVILKSGGQRRNFKPGEVIFREGDFPSREAFIIEEGVVQILKTGGEGREFYLDESRAGEIIGEMALVDNRPRMATARAVGPCRLVVITAEEFGNALAKTDSVARRLIDVMVRRLRYQSSEITRLKVLLNASK